MAEKQEEKEREKQKQNNQTGENGKLEEKWEMLRWISNFMEEHKDRWEKERIEREKAKRQEEEKLQHHGEKRQEKRG